ncbi:hypothetical protein NDN08_002133 [Rhodosorus marinus]|uniref:Uncharacterized protein n=1 Tax=Rhodosorus marinus TaxID=101924 RepID=A0AAV8UWI5_9RHOD|nr:hypothetical protein NDN08_002133 [Rhodosorus marinus]
MKHGLVVILLAGIFGLTVGDDATCATFFNPLVSYYTISPSCYTLEVEDETVGTVSNSDVVKTQGPNKGETCIRFTFVVRNGLGIRRAKLGLWLRDIPLDQARFTRKRKFLDSEPNTVRVDACLDDIQTEGDCCSEESSTPLLVVEAKVRMEDGKVRTARLVGNDGAPVRQQVSDPPLATSDITCRPQALSPSLLCDRVSDQDGIPFWACRVALSCLVVGSPPEFGGINRIDKFAGTVQVVIVPAETEFEPGAIELTLYEPMIPLRTSGNSIRANANTVVRRPAASVQDFGSFSIVTFAVPELAELFIVAFTVEFAFTPPLRYSVRAQEKQRDLVEFISFFTGQVVANSGPYKGLQATDSYFGGPLEPPGLLEDVTVVGRIGSVVCGYCFNSNLPPRGEWEVLQSGQPEGLNEGQFSAELARQPGRCIFDAQIGSFGSVCGPPGALGILQYQDIVKGQVVCKCTQPTPPPTP